MKIIILSDTKITKQAHVKALFIKEFQNSCDTEVWDCSEWYKGRDGEKFYNSLNIHNEAELIQNLKRVCEEVDTVFAVHAMIMDSYVKVEKYLRKYGVISICLDSESYGRWIRYEIFYKYRKEMQFKAQIKAQIQHSHLFRSLYFFIKYRGIKFDYSFGRCNYIPELNKKFIESHYHNNDELKKILLSSPTVSNKYAVFIDTAFATHPGFSRFKDKPDALEYFRQMRTYFDEFERRNNIPIIIAAYPKVQLEQDAFGKRKIYYDCTPELIKGASVVLLHTSSTLMIAAALKKPLIFLYCEKWKDTCAKSFYYESRYYSELLGAPWKDIENPCDTYFFDVNEKKYDSFIKSTIINPEKADKSNFELLLEAMKNISN